MDIAIQGTSSALTNAVKGAKDSEVKFAKAAQDVVKSYSAAANSVSNAGAPSNEATPLANTQNETTPVQTSNLSDETLAATSDPVKPIVDMMQSKRTYEANLKVFSAVSEMDEALTDILA